MRALLLWPGTRGVSAGNFGIPQLATMATYCRAKTGVPIDLRDLGFERALPGFSLDRALFGDDGAGYDVVGISVYSSFDWLKSVALAERVRARCPNAVIVAGGYHASSRPIEVIAEESPFDVCVVGEGEKPFAQVLEAVKGGAPPRKVVLGSDAIEDLDAELPPTDWSLLDRYKGVLRKTASQAQVYFSRGCPFDCSFCMERAKREVSWRSFSPDRAIGEIASFHERFDLTGFTLNIADALFGMKKSWRREVLEKLAARALPFAKIWTLIRLDLVEDEDLRLFRDANCAMGFGLETGDERMMRVIRKANRPAAQLERMIEIAAYARENQVAWGGNVIAGHPGETRESLTRSAEFMRALFLHPKGTTGFLSVDPFRLYPGSPIDGERGRYERDYGSRFHRPDWWHEGDPEFLSEWVDPSSDLDYATRESMTHDLFAPIIGELADRYVYEGPGRDYMLRAVRHNVRTMRPSFRLPFMARYYAWQRYLGRGAHAEARRQGDAALAAVCRAERRRSLRAIAERLGISNDAPEIAALIAVPRERFVPLELIEESCRDLPLLDPKTGATIGPSLGELLAWLRAAPQVAVDDAYRQALLAELGLASPLPPPVPPVALAPERSRVRLPIL